VASLVGRLSMAMNGLALLLLTKEVTGSYAQAGLVAGANGIAFACIAPRWAREADRRGPSPVLRFSAMAHPAAMVLFVVLALADAPGPVLVVFSALIGATDPPLGSVMRAGWTRVIDAALLRTAYSLESVSVEVCFVTGPLLVAGLASAVHPAVAVLASAAFSGAGTFRLSTVPFIRGVVGHENSGSRLAGPLADPTVRSLLLMFAFVGLGFGASEVSVIAFVEESGQPRPVGGIVLACWSLGSMVGGLVYGGLHLRSHPARQLPLLAGVLGCVALLPMTAGSIPALTALMATYGLFIAPFFACQSLVLGDAAPEGTVTEAFAWTSSMIFAGAAAGTALAGAVVEARGAVTGLVLTAGSGALLALLVLASRGQLSRLAVSSG
jgi:predicted MFS family arabinose efflux permease